MWAVILNDSPGGGAYGPFTEAQLPLAERFVEFLAEEVDPAHLIALGAHDDLTSLKCPITALLDWRNAMKPHFRWLEETRGDA